MATAALASDALLSKREAQRAALTMVPLVAMIVGVVIAILFAVSVPSSRPPSQDAVVSCAFVMWLTSAASFVVCAVALPGARLRTRRCVAVAVGIALVGVGWEIGRRIQVAWVDACEFGSGSGDRCIRGDGSAPDFVLIAWPVAGLLIAWLATMVASIACQDD